MDMPKSVGYASPVGYNQSLYVGESYLSTSPGNSRYPPYYTYGNGSYPYVNGTTGPGNSSYPPYYGSYSFVNGTTGPGNSSYPPYYGSYPYANGTTGPGNSSYPPYYGSYSFVNGTTGPGNSSYPPYYGSYPYANGTTGPGNSSYPPYYGSHPYANGTYVYPAYNGSYTTNNNFSSGSYNYPYPGVGPAFDPWFGPVDPISRQLQAVQAWYYEMGGMGAVPNVLSSGPGCPPSVVIAVANSTSDIPPGGPADLCSTDGVMSSSSVPGILDNEALGEPFV